MERGLETVKKQRRSDQRAVASGGFLSTVLPVPSDLLWRVPAWAAEISLLVFHAPELPASLLCEQAIQEGLERACRTLLTLRPSPPLPSLAPKHNTVPDTGFQVRMIRRT